MSSRRKTERFPPRSTKSWPSPSRPKINKKECSRILDNLPQTPYNKSFHRVNPICVRLNETQLLQKLRHNGGFNPRYMATRRKEAVKFSDLSGDEQPVPHKSSLFPPAKHGQALNKQLDAEMSVNGLNLLQHKIRRLTTSKERSQKRMVSLGPASISRRCWSRGSVVDGTTPLMRLCTECSATTTLPASVFPPFINEVICGDLDQYCYGPIGQCAQRVLRFTFLRRTGQFERDDALSRLLGEDVYIEEWVDFEQDIRSCCECRLFSFLTRSRS